MKRIYHITTQLEAMAAKDTGYYQPTAYEREGFIHCSYSHQVIPVANRLFKGRTDLVVMEIEPAALDCRLIDENLEGGSELYPHVYGRLPMAAVIRIQRFTPDAGGLFSRLAE